MKRCIIILLIAVAFGGLFLRYSDRAPKRHYSDFRVYYATAKRFAGGGDIYERPDMSIGPFKYSPMFAMLVSPLALFSQKTASLVFFTINFIALIFTFVLSKRLIVRDEISFKQSILLYGLAVLCSLRFSLHVMDSGQIGIIMLAMVVAGLYFLEKGREFVSAGLISLSVMFKYTSGVFLPYFLFRRKIKLVLLIILFLFCFCLIPSLYVGIDKGIDYIKSWLPAVTGTSFDMGSWYDGKNRSLFSMSLRYFTNVSPYGVSIANLSFNQGIGLALLAGAIGYFFIVLPGRNDYFSRSAEYSLLFIFMALFNPNAWIHNFVVLAFAYMTLFYYLIKVNFRDRVTLTLVAISVVLTSLTGDTFLGDPLEGLLENLSFVTIGSIILAVALFRLKFRRN